MFLYYLCNILNIITVRVLFIDCIITDIDIHYYNIKLHPKSKYFNIMRL